MSDDYFIMYIPKELQFYSKWEFVEIYVLKLVGCKYSPLTVINKSVTIVIIVID